MLSELSAFTTSKTTVTWLYIQCLKASIECSQIVGLMLSQLSPFTTVWRRPIGCPKLQVIFRKRATNHRALLQKMTYKYKASYGSLLPCSAKSALTCLYIMKQFTNQLLRKSSDSLVKILKKSACSWIYAVKLMWRWLLRNSILCRNSVVSSCNQKFSKGSATIVWCSATVVLCSKCVLCSKWRSKLTFWEFFTSPCRDSDACPYYQKFSKVSATVVLYSNCRSKLTFWEIFISPCRDGDACPCNHWVLTKYVKFSGFKEDVQVYGQDHLF